MLCLGSAVLRTATMRTLTRVFFIAIIGAALAAIGPSDSAFAAKTPSPAEIHRIIRYLNNATPKLGGGRVSPDLVGHITDPTLETIQSVLKNGLLPNYPVQAVTIGDRVYPPFTRPIWVGKPQVGADETVFVYGLNSRSGANRSGISVLVKDGSEITVTGAEMLKRLGLENEGPFTTAKLNSKGPYTMYPPESIVGLAAHDTLPSGEEALPELIWPRGEEGAQLAAEYGLAGPPADAEFIRLSRIARPTRTRLSALLLRARILGRYLTRIPSANGMRMIGGGVVGGLLGGIVDSAITDALGNTEGADAAGMTASVGTQAALMYLVGGAKLAKLAVSLPALVGTVATHYWSEQMKADTKRYQTMIQGARLPLPTPGHGRMGPDRSAVLTEYEQSGRWLSWVWGSSRL